MKNLPQCFPKFILDIVFNTALEDLQYLGAMVPPHSENERKVEFFGVTPVEILKFFKFGVATNVKACARLFISRSISHITLASQAPREIWVSAKQCYLRLATCYFNHIDKGTTKTCCGVIPRR